MLKPGIRVGGLVIGELLGRGAMGEVYRAEQVALKRPVAVKRIAEHLAENPEVVARFEREAQCIARITAQNVLSVYEFGRFEDEEGDVHWLLVMELVDGGASAKAFMGENGMPWKEASSIILQVAEGLSVVAEDGIIHRDIKPDNIMLTVKGVAKLADFGLAKATDSHGMTMTGSLLGTPYYMAPEACRGESIEHSGDLYSLGATWFHLLTGRPPFQAKNTMMLLRAHCEEAPPTVDSIKPDVPKQIAALVATCLAKKVENRPRDAGMLVMSIQALMAEGLTVPRTASALLSQEPRDESTPRTAVTMVAGTISADSTQAAVGATAVPVQKVSAIQPPSGAATVVPDAAAEPAPQPSSPPAPAAATPSSSKTGLLIAIVVLALVVGGGVGLVAGGVIPLGGGTAETGDASAGTDTEPSTVVTTATTTVSDGEAASVQQPDATDAVAKQTPPTDSTAAGTTTGTESAEPLVPPTDTSATGELASTGGTDGTGDGSTEGSAANGTSASADVSTATESSDPVTVSSEPEASSTGPTDTATRSEPETTTTESDVTTAETAASEVVTEAGDAVAAAATAVTSATKSLPVVTTAETEPAETNPEATATPVEAAATVETPADTVTEATEVVSNTATAESTATSTQTAATETPAVTTEPIDEPTVVAPDPAWLTALDQAEKEFKAKGLAEAHRWLETIGQERAENLDAAFEERYASLRKQVTTAIESAVSASIQEAISALEEQRWPEALKILEKSRPLAEINGSTSSHDKYIDFLRQRLQ